MTQTYPFGFPTPTAMYMALYAVSLVLHVVLMAYVLGGSLVLVGRAVVGLRWRDHRPDRLAEVVVRDWLPFFLGAAITAGVAPLLFLQVLYKQSFYTANLLLLHRWMALVPALIVAFYLLYVQKTDWMRAAAPWARCAVSLLAWALFVFAASSWTENHLLSLQGLATWVPFYMRGQQVYADPAFWPRLGVWLGGALPLWATIVATQIWWLRRRRLEHPDTPESTGQAFAVADNIRFESARLPLCAMGGLVVAGICALGYPQQTANAAPLWEIVWGPLCRAYVIGGSVGLMLQTVGWWRMRHTRRIDGGVLAALWTGALLMVLGTTVVRETLRLACVDVTAFYEQHAQAAAVGGGVVFAIFAVVNAILIGWCLTQVARAPLMTTAKERKEVELR